MLKRWGLFYGWSVVFAIAVLSFGTTGARFSFSAFYKPMLEEFNWSRTALAMAPALNLLLSAALRPIGGWLVDRYGAKYFAVVGIVVCGIALALFSRATELWQVYALFMVLSIGYVAGPVTTVKIAASWFVRRRAMALSLASTGTSAGELVILPLATWMLLVSSWQASYIMLSVLLLFLVLPIGLIFLKNTPDEVGTYPDGDAPGSSGAAITAANTANDRNATLSEAMRSPTFYKLGVGFFVCGFTMAFANTHFIAFATDHGFEAMVAATALALVGAFSIPGALTMGYLSDRVGRQYVLAAVYFLRGLAFVVLLGVDSPFTLYLASFVLGVSWTSTTPQTSAIAADLWGLKSIGVIYGSLFTIMPIGSAVGLVLDAWIFDTQNNYQLALWFNVFAGLIAGLAVMSIREKRLAVKKKGKVPAAVGAGADKT